MLHEEGSSSCRLLFSARSWYHGWAGLNLRFWETLSEVIVQHHDNGSAGGEIPRYSPVHQESSLISVVLFTFPALRLPSVPEAPDPEMVTPA